MFKIKEAAMGSVAMTSDLYTYISVTAFTQESGRGTFIKQAVCRFGWVVFGLILGWLVLANFDGSLVPPPSNTVWWTK